MLSIYRLLLTQTPKGTPNPGESKPIDFSDPFEVIVFIILPILIIAFYFLWRKKNRGKNK
ncbi:adenylosuccinate synthetase [Winogradskyella schleiferi]|uniref:adenylosuccinate synthetase n=1 Tax=Winogradskyella schleiferi TaxID=2686078 RepID=UPI0015BC7F6A|nr:adenylosuccinate synthetase [Winogradskyella schleiferi]